MEKLNVTVKNTSDINQLLVLRKISLFYEIGVIEARPMADNILYNNIPTELETDLISLLEKETGCKFEVHTATIQKKN